jgi:hypothetical protein
MLSRFFTPHKTPLWSVTTHEMLSVVAIKSLTTHLGTTKLSLPSIRKSSINKKGINKNMFLGQVPFGYSWPLTIAG